MEWLIPPLCLCALFVPTLVGVGITFLTERHIGRWAYVLGWLLPVIILVIFYGAYDIALRVTPCFPADSLACGQPLAGAFLFFVGLVCITVIANALAQIAVYLYLNSQRPPQYVEESLEYQEEYVYGEQEAPTGYQ